MLRILVVDDNAVVRKTLMHLLMLHGHMVVGTGNEKQAISMCEDLMPDVVMVDMFLDGHSGLDVIRSLQDVAPRPYLIAMTGGKQSVLDKALDLGADDVLQKPFGVTEMLEKFTVSAA